jgi:hypothetical protein
MISNQKTYEYKKRVLNLYLNSYYPLPKNRIFISGEHSYLGYILNRGLIRRVTIFDFDGVFEFPDSTHLYRLFAEELCNENSSLKLRWGDLDECFSFIQETGDIPTGEKKIEGIFKDCHLTKKQSEDATKETIKKFEFARNAKLLVPALEKETGHESFIISGSYGIVLSPIGEILGIDMNNIYASELNFDDETEAFTGISLRLNSRKVEARNSILKRFADTTSGRCYIFSDDPKLDAPLAKSGLNPSVFLGRFERSELPFDVSVPCPEARENMLKLIPKVQRGDLGWLVANYRSIEKEKTISDLALDVQEVSEQMYVENRRRLFIRKSIELINNCKDFVEEKRYVEGRILDLMSAEDEDENKELMRELSKFFKDNVVESNAKRGWLDDLIQ